MQRHQIAKQIQKRYKCFNNNYYIKRSQFERFVRQINISFIWQHEQNLKNIYPQWDQYAFQAAQAWIKQSKDKQSLISLAKKYDIEIPVSQRIFLQSIIVPDQKFNQQIKNSQQQIQIQIQSNQQQIGTKFKKTKKIFHVWNNQKRDFQRQRIRKRTFMTTNQYYNQFMKERTKRLSFENARTLWTRMKIERQKIIEANLPRIFVHRTEKFRNKKNVRAICSMCRLVCSANSMRLHLKNCHSFDLLKLIIQRKSQFGKKAILQVFCVQATQLQSQTIAPQQQAQIQWNQSTKQFQPIIIKQNQAQIKPQTNIQNQFLVKIAQYPSNAVKQLSLEQMKQLLTQKKFISLSQIQLSQHLDQDQLIQLKKKAQNDAQKWQKMEYVIKNISNKVVFVKGILKAIPQSFGRRKIAGLINYQHKLMQTIQFREQEVQMFPQNSPQMSSYEAGQIIKGCNGFLPQQILTKMQKPKFKHHIIGQRKSYFWQIVHRYARGVFYLKENMRKLRQKMRDYLGCFLIAKKLIQNVKLKINRQYGQKWKKQPDGLKALRNCQLFEAERSKYCQKQYKVITKDMKSILDQLYNFGLKRVAERNPIQERITVNHFSLTQFKQYCTQYEQNYTKTYRLQLMIQYILRVIDSEGKQRINDQSILQNQYAPEITDKIFLHCHFVLKTFWMADDKPQPYTPHKIQRIIKIAQQDMQQLQRNHLKFKIQLRNEAIKQSQNDY